MHQAPVEESRAAERMGENNVSVKEVGFPICPLVGACNNRKKMKCASSRDVCSDNCFANSQMLCDNCLVYLHSDIR